MSANTAPRIKLQTQIAKLSAQFGIQPSDDIKYDPHAGAGIFIGDNPLRVAEIQLEIMQASALKKAGIMLDTHKRVPKFNGQTGAKTERPIYLKRIVFIGSGG